MDSVEEVLARAKQRARELNLSYAGALLPEEAYALQQAVPGAAMVDVRTQAEWYWVGRVPGAAMIEWTTFPGGTRNPDFLAQLRSAVPPTNAPVMFICRSGQRSHHAAALATEAGYANCFNVLEGFEGDRDQRNHRNSVNGWRVAGLPWEQG